MYVYSFIVYICSLTCLINTVFLHGNIAIKSILRISKLTVVSYSTHQLQLKRDTCGTSRGHASCTRMFLSCTRNYMHYQLPSCLGLHTSSPPFCTQSFIYTHTRVLAVVRIITTCTSLDSSLRNSRI